MARFDDFELQVRSEPAPALRKTPQPAASPTHNHSTLEKLLYPVVIINRQGNICFMNGAARRLLSGELDQKLASHIRSNPGKGPIGQVHFKLQNGRDLILKVCLGDIEWLGEKATQVSLSNVTSYLAMIQELQKELQAQKQSLEELAARQPEMEEQQPAGHGEAPAKLQAEEQAASTARELEPARGELSRRMDEAQLSEKAWMQERAELHRRAAELAGSIEQGAKKLGDSEAARLQAATEAARLSKQLAEQAAAAEALRTAPPRSEEQAASMAQALSSVEAALKARMAECAQATEELWSLHTKLDAEVRAHRLAQEKIAQFQQEMAAYRQTAENPTALREAEAQIGQRIKELAVAEEQVRNLTEELRTARAGNAQQDQRVDRLRRFASEMKTKCDALAASAKSRVEEQDQLRAELHEEKARRQAAEAEVERLRRQPARAQPVEPEPVEEFDGDFIADLRKEIQAASRAASPKRLGPVTVRPSAPPGTPVRKAS